MAGCLRSCSQSLSKLKRRVVAYATIFYKAPMSQEEEHWTQICNPGNGPLITLTLMVMGALVASLLLWIPRLLFLRTLLHRLRALDFPNAVLLVEQDEALMTLEEKDILLQPQKVQSQSWTQTLRALSQSYQIKSLINSGFAHLLMPVPLEVEAPPPTPRESTTDELILTRQYSVRPPSINSVRLQSKMRTIIQNGELRQAIVDNLKEWTTYTIAHPNHQLFPTQKLEDTLSFVTYGLLLRVGAIVVVGTMLVLYACH